MGGSGEDGEAVQHVGVGAAVDRELLEADDAVLVRVHAAEHSLQVLNLHFGGNLGANKIVN